MDCTLNTVISTDIAALQDKRSHSQACDKRRTTAVQVDDLGACELSRTFRALQRNSFLQARVEVM
jgi:hypothetical protein